MGLQSAMTTALTGLQAAETTIDVVGNNVANSNTVGFKESNVLFATQFLQTQSIGSAPSTSSGGTNPRQIGLGVKRRRDQSRLHAGHDSSQRQSARPGHPGRRLFHRARLAGRERSTRATASSRRTPTTSSSPSPATACSVTASTIEFNLVETLVPLTIPRRRRDRRPGDETAYFSGALTPTAEVGDTPAIIQSEMLGDAADEFPADPNFDLRRFHRPRCADRHGDDRWPSTSAPAIWPPAPTNTSWPTSRNRARRPLPTKAPPAPRSVRSRSVRIPTFNSPAADRRQLERPKSLSIGRRWRRSNWCHARCHDGQLQRHATPRPAPR